MHRSLATAAGPLDLSRPILVAIANRTPDSFSDGGVLDDLDFAVDHLAQLVADGADMLDIGGESTRPGAAEVSIDEELARVVPLIEAAVARFPVPISVDTRRAEVARAALSSGACVVNDVSGFGDPDMASVVGSFGAGWVLMHMPGDVGQMQWNTATEQFPTSVKAGLEAVAAALAGIVEKAENAGVQRDQLAVDPGIGFGKSAAQNLGFLRDFGPIAKVGLPIYVGPSRKSFLGAVTGRPADDRVYATAAAVTASVLAGAAFVRVHDVAAMRDVVDVAAAIASAT